MQQAMHPTVVLSDPPPVPPVPPVPPDADIVQAFPQFEILQLIGAGGMGRVYQVRQPHLEPGAALKILPKEMAADPSLPPDAAFDRQWALTLLNRAMDSLEAQFAAEGKAEVFRILKPWLTGEPAEPQATAAAALGLSVTAVKVAIHRLRQRFREQLRAELAATLDSAAMVEEEMGHLFAALSHAG